MCDHCGERPRRTAPDHPTETHPYDRACRNTQHSGCTCMHSVGGKWCGLPRNDPVHADQPTEAPSADRRNEIRALMQEWSSARFTNAGHTPAARSMVADAGLELLVEIDALTAEPARQHRDNWSRETVRSQRRKIRNLKAEMGRHDAGRAKDRVWFWRELGHLRERISRLTAERDDARADVEAVRAHWQHELSKATDVIAETGAQLNDARAALQAAEGREAGLRDALEKLADVAQFVLDRITEGATSDERYAMKDAARIAMAAYHALAASDRSDPEG